MTTADTPRYNLDMPESTISHVEQQRIPNSDTANALAGAGAGTPENLNPFVMQASVDMRTQTALTASFDPATGADRPPVGTIWDAQSAIDAYLAAQGKTAFKFLSSFWDFVPARVAFDITLSLSAGTHLVDPNRSGTSTYAYRWNKEYIDGAHLRVEGEADTSLWTELDVGGTIQSHVPASDNPSLTFPASTFTNDGSLEGAFVVTSDGYVGLIHEHTDAVLRVTSVIDPVPTDTVSTATVRRPSTVLKNSEDGSTDATTAMLEIDMHADRSVSSCYIDDIHMQPGSGGGIHIQFLSGWLRATRVTMDFLNGAALYAQPLIPGYARVSLAHCAVLATESAAGGDFVMNVTNRTNVTASFCLFRGGEDGMRFWTGAWLQSYACVYSGIGRNGLGADGGAMVSLSDFNSLIAMRTASFQAGVRNTFRNADANIAGLYLNKGVTAFNSAADLDIDFVNMGANPFVIVGERTTMDTEGSAAGNGLRDGGGSNTGPIVKLLGPYSAVKLGAADFHTDVSKGVQMPDLTIKTIAQLEAGPVVDAGTYSTADKIP